MVYALAALVHEEAMYITNNAQDRARWAVMWVASNGKTSKVVRKDFGDDLASAMKLYLKAHDADKRAATLACVNMGFPPPVELRTYTVRKRGRVRRTGKIKTVTVEINPLRELNLKGKVWCPYCRQIRSFRLQKTSSVNGIRFSDPKYACPICGISNRDHNVQRWNPTATLHMQSSLASMQRTRKPKQQQRRRRRR